MKINNRFAGFWDEESGAVTVDWVALVATVVLIGIGTAVGIGTGTKGLADSVSTEVASRGVWTY